MKEATPPVWETMEARIFDPQILMLDDPEVVDRTIEYIRGNHLTAAQAFEWRILELRAMWERTYQPMVLDRINDLDDLHSRLLRTDPGPPGPVRTGRARTNPSSWWPGT